MIETLISSKTRIKLLLKFFLNSKNSSYLRGLESEFGDSSNAIRVELNRFEEAGLLDTEFVGNKKFFKANTNHPFYSDIHAILIKFTGLDKIVEKVIDNIGELEQVYVVGNLANGLNSNIIDLIFVGDIDRNYLFELVEKAQVILSKKIKYICYKSEDFKTDEIANSVKDSLLLWSK